MMWFASLFGVFMSVVPLSQIRNRDVGDWYVTPNDTLIVLAAETGSWRYNYLLLIHEAVEAWLCRRHCVTEDAVNEWDGAYDGDSPGDDPHAPYHAEHVWATRVERIASWLLLVSWTRYEDRVDELWEAQHA